MYKNDEREEIKYATSYIHCIHQTIGNVIISFLFIENILIGCRRCFENIRNKNNVYVYTANEI